MDVTFWLQGNDRNIVDANREKLTFIFLKKNKKKSAMENLKLSLRNNLLLKVI